MVVAVVRDARWCAVVVRHGSADDDRRELPGRHQHKYCMWPLGSGEGRAGSDVYWRGSVWCVRVWVQCVFTGGLGHGGRSIVNGSIATTV